MQPDSPPPSNRCLFWALLLLVGCSAQPMGHLILANYTPSTLKVCFGATPWPRCVPEEELPLATDNADILPIMNKYKENVEPIVWPAHSSLFGILTDYDGPFRSVFKNGIVIVDRRGKQRHIPLDELLQRRECLGTGSPCQFWRIRLDSKDLPP